MRRHESYKPSGEHWLGDVPGHWKMIALKHIARLKSGDAITSVAMDHGKYPVYGGNGHRGNYSKFTHDGDYALIGRQGALCGNINYATGKFWASEHAIVVSPQTEMVPKWLGELLRAMNLNQYSVAAAQPGLSVGTVANLKIPVPPPAEQKKIATVLEQKSTDIDAAIAKKERLIKLLQEHADIQIELVVTRGLNPDAPMRDSWVAWIGQVPVHWKQLANRALFRERMEPGQADLPILSVSIHTAVSDEEQDGTENIRAKIRIEDKTSYKRVRPGDVTYNMMRAWQGAIGVVRVDGLVSPAYVVAAPLATINGAYFEYLYRTHGFIREMDRYSKGITDFRKRLYWDEFKQLVSLLPPLDEQIQIAAYAEQIINKTSALKEKIRGQIDALNEFRASLIENLVTGKIKA